MRNQHRLIGALAAGAVLLSATGCLSLGEKTVYSSESPETSKRIAALEARVGILEHTELGNPVLPGTLVPPGPADFSQR